MGSIREAINQYRQQALAWERDKTYSQAHKAEEIEKLRADTHSEVYATVQRNFGEKGEMWRRLDQARVQLSQAQAKGPEIDYGRLSFVTKQVESVLSETQSVAEFSAWYDQAGEYERMAAQAIRSQVEARFGRRPRIGALLARLRADSQAVNPEVAAAREALISIEAEIEEMVTEAEAAARTLGEKQAFLGYASADSSPILATISVVQRDGDTNEIIRGEPGPKIHVRSKGEKTEYNQDQLDQGTKMNWE